MPADTRDTMECPRCHATAEIVDNIQFVKKSEMPVFYVKNRGKAYHASKTCWKLGRTPEADIGETRLKDVGGLTKCPYCHHGAESIEPQR